MQSNGTYSNCSETNIIDTKIKLAKLEKDFHFNIDLLSQRDSLIENYRVAIQKLSLLLLENGCINQSQIASILQNMSIQQDVTQVNSATQFPDAKMSEIQPTFPTYEPFALAPHFYPSYSEEVFSTKMMEFLNYYHSILKNTSELISNSVVTSNGTNKLTEDENQKFNHLVSELQSTNRKISQLQDCNNDLSNHVSSKKIELQELVQDKRQLVEKVTSLQDEFSVQKSLFYSFYRCRERAFLDAKERFVDIESKLVEEIESLQVEIAQLKMESTQFEFQHQKQHQHAVNKNSKLRKLLFVLKEFIANERNTLSQQLATREHQIEQLTMNIQSLKDTIIHRSEEITVLEKELDNSHRQNQSLAQEKRQIELDYLHGDEKRQQELTAAHQSRLENIQLEQQQTESETNQKLTQLQEIITNLNTEKEKCLKLVNKDIDSIDDYDDSLYTEFMEILDQNAKLKELIEELKMKSSTEYTNNSSQNSRKNKPFINPENQIRLNPVTSQTQSNKCNLTFEEIESLQTQLNQKFTEATQLHETINDLKTVLSQKDSLINSFNQHFSLLKSLSPSPYSQPSFSSKHSKHETSDIKLMHLVQRIVSLTREKNRLIEANHKLKLENVELRQKHSETATEVPSKSTNEIELESSDHGNQCSNFQENAHSVSKNILSPANTDSGMVPLNITHDSRDSSHLVFKMQDDCPDWFNESNFQRALFYADNPELIDSETLSNSRVLTDSILSP